MFKSSESLDRSFTCGGIPVGEFIFLDGFVVTRGRRLERIVGSFNIRICRRGWPGQSLMVMRMVELSILK